MAMFKSATPIAVSLLCAVNASACKKNSLPETQVQQALSGDVIQCDVIVVGGTTAAYATAVTAADNMQSGEVVCLTEPTDWIGGQLTSSGVPAVDFPHHEAEIEGLGKVKLSDAGRQMSAQNKWFGAWMSQLGPISNGAIAFPATPTCWVSVRCFPPTSIIGSINSLAATYESSGRLRILRNTVVKSVTAVDSRISTVTVIQRRAIGKVPERLSEQVKDWYDPENSATFKKTVYTLTGPKKSVSGGKAYFPVVVDATEWGELLVLSGSSYLQGMERNDDAPVGQGTQETCGQAIVYPMTLRLNETPVPDSALAGGRWASEIRPQIEAYKKSLVSRGLLAQGSSLYSIATNSRAFTFDEVWLYRRIVVGPVERKEKDYPYRYLFLPFDKARAQSKDNWQGGIDIAALAEAELQALGWVDHLRDNAKVTWNGSARDIGPHIVLSESLGAPFGLSKVPYIRDTRRSIGFNFDGNPYVLRYGEIFKGTQFDDSIGIGAYAADRHPSRNPNVNGERCATASSAPGYSPFPKPFTIPLRALTHAKIENLLVAGKTMAQTFHTNSATRLHPIEFASGTGAGALASVMAQAQVSSHFVVKSQKHIGIIQERVKKYQPIAWSQEMLKAGVVKPVVDPERTPADKPSEQSKF